MAVLAWVLMTVALILFVVAAFFGNSGRVNLIALAFALWVLAILLPGFPTLG